LARQVIKIVYHDGKEAGREVMETRIINPPVNQVVAMGTITSVSRGNLRFDFREARQMAATAYTYTGNRTASGQAPAVGLVAVDTSVIPMGSRLYVEGYGFARAADRGGAIQGDRIDVFLESEQECYRWGNRRVKVYVLE
jgi:3D (Asp-Asp-Asp) domain-containing protein